MSVYSNVKNGQILKIMKGKELVVEGIVDRISFDSVGRTYIHLDNGWIVVFEGDGE